MILNSHIAVFFALVFFGKFLVVDSKFLTSFLEPEEVVYINPFCKELHGEIFLEDSTEKTYFEDGWAAGITIDSFCNAPFQFEIFSWEQRNLWEELPFCTSPTPSLSGRVQGRFYPPPQIPIG